MLTTRYPDANHFRNPNVLLVYLVCGHVKCKGFLQADTGHWSKCMFSCFTACMAEETAH